MGKINVVGSNIIEKDNKILLMQETLEKVRGKWNLPAGKLDMKENIITCAGREGEEETGFKLKLLFLVGIYQHHLNLENNVILFVFKSEIEVGIDIPNATVMMIEGAERFGLAQLHQFRGRVGRASYQSYCLLFTDSHSRKTHQRLRVLINSEDGFALAEKDLEIRGPGDFKGARQWGIPDLMMNSLKDISLVEKTRESAKQILSKDPQLKKHPQLLAKLGKFRERIHLE